MSHVIAVAGKGGVGKTTICGLIIQYLAEQLLFWQLMLTPTRISMKFSA